MLSVPTVHANRVIQELRAQNLMSWSGKKFTVLHWQRLKAAGEVDPAYLHLNVAAA